MGSPPADSIANDWQLQCDDIQQRGLQVLKSGLWADCTFLVGPELVSLPAHRLLLAMASPVFQAMFYGSMAAGSSTPVKISDVDPDVFKALLHYIYTDKVTAASFDSVCALYYAARKYMLHALARQCLAHIRHNLLAENVCQAYELATLFDEKKLAEACLREICNNTSKVVKASSFDDVELSTLVTVVSQESLCIASELELLQASERYARRRGGGLKRCLDVEGPGEAKIPKLEGEKGVGNFVEVQMQHDIMPDAGQTEDSDDEAQQECRASMRKALEHIRFLSLSAAQFAEGAAGSPLLTEEDTFSLLVNIAHPDTAEPLPTGFCPSRARRPLPEHMRSKVKKVVGGGGAHSSEVMMEYTVKNFKNRKRPVESETFVMLGGMEWRLRVVPEETGAAEKTVGVYVKCRGPAGPSWACSAELTITVRHHGSASRHMTVTCQHEFNRSSDTRGWPRLVSWSDLCDRGYLHGNALTLDAHIHAELPPPGTHATVSRG